MQTTFSSRPVSGINNIMLSTLNNVFTIAIPSGVATAVRIGGAKTDLITQYMISHTSAPPIFKVRCATAARFASRFVPILESIAVIQVTIGIAAPKVICPVILNACKIPTEAELD